MCVASNNDRVCRSQASNKAGIIAGVERKSVVVYCLCLFCFVQIMARGDDSHKNVGSGTASCIVELKLGGHGRQAPRDRVNSKLDLGVSLPGLAAMISREPLTGWQ